MAALTAALLAAQVGSQFFAQRAQANAAQQQGTYERAQFNQNAQIAEWQAEDAMRRGEEAVGAKVAETRQAVGSARAAGGGSGVTGPASELADEYSTLGAFDAITLKNNAAREAWGYRTEATQARGQGELAYRTGRQTASALRNQAFGTLLTGAVQGAEMYKQYRRDNPKK
jgi:hypothetical protein